jgi:hypothetical protein
MEIKGKSAVKRAIALSLGAGILLAGCTYGPQVPKGQATIQGRGSEELTNKGDPLMQSGSAARQVPAQFAAGYTKGISDQVKRTYWAQQAEQAASSGGYSDSGKLKFYDATIPEHTDPDGVVRVQRRVIIPIVD